MLSMCVYDVYGKVLPNTWMEHSSYILDLDSVRCCTGNCDYTSLLGLLCFQISTACKLLAPFHNHTSTQLTSSICSNLTSPLNTEEISMKSQASNIEGWKGSHEPQNGAKIALSLAPNGFFACLEPDQRVRATLGDRWSRYGFRWCLRWCKAAIRGVWLVLDGFSGVVEALGQRCCRPHLA